MPILAKDIIQRVVITLQDPTSIRWPADELARYLNDAQREIMLHRPDSLVVSGPLPLVAGTRQTLPAGATKLVDVRHNSAGTKRAIRITNREILDAQLPGWNGQTPSSEVLHFMYDPREARTFHVYPPAPASGASVQAVYAVEPVDVPAPPTGGTADTVTGSLSLQAIYANAVQDYVLYRAYTKDSEYAGNAARAQAHYAAFANALGLEIKATVAVAPTSTGNPNLSPNGAGAAA